MNAFIEQVRGGLIVSCQALPDEPLHSPDIMARLALAATIGGAVGIRANTPLDIRAIKAAVNLPVIGIHKDGDEGVYITPTTAHALGIVDAGAEVVALDATARPRPNGETAAQIIAAVHERGRLVLADVATMEEAQAAQAAGADFVAPTLNGYTDAAPPRHEPDFDLLRALVIALDVPVIAEGHISTPEQARAALDAGVLAVVVGSAITRPRTITARFVAGMQGPSNAT